jgi:hypothetical protein
MHIPTFPLKQNKPAYPAGNNTFRHAVLSFGSFVT